MSGPPIDVNAVARAICESYTARKMKEFVESGHAPATTEPALRILIERAVQKHWQEFLPDARAAIAIVEKG